MNPENAEAPLPSEAPTDSQALTAPTARNRSPAAGRQQGLFHGYRMTDDVLFHPWLTTTEKLVLGAFAAHPRRSPSHRYLRAHTPIHHDSIEAALTRIEEVFGLAIFDRPHGPQDRDPITRRFARANRAMMLAPAADPARPENARRSVVLPARIAAALRRGQRNSGLAVLVALLYVREQLRRGAIHADDEAVAAMLHTEARKVRRIREQMIRDSVLVHAKKAPGSAIYTMPGATARTPAAADLDVTRTRRLRLLPIDIGTPIHALANDREWSAIQSALAQTPTTGHALAVTEAWLSDARKTPTGASTRPMLGRAPLAADPLLRGLNSARHRLSQERTRPSGIPTQRGGDVDRSGEHDWRVQGSERSCTYDQKEQDLTARASRGPNVYDGSAKGIDHDRRFSSTEQAVDAIMANLSPALAEVFGPERAARRQKAAQTLESAVTKLAQLHRLRGGLQAQIVLDEANHQLSQISASKALPERYAQLKTAARWMLSDDDLYEQIKNARPAPTASVLDRLEAEFGKLWTEDAPANEG